MMQADSFSLAWLSDPTVFAVNRLPPVSDHDFYRNEAEAAEGKTSLVRSLNGTWRMAYAVRPAGAPRDYWREGFDDSHFQAVQVPLSIQLQGYDHPHYVNTQYPWDGWEELKSGEVSQAYNPTASYVRRFTLTEAECAMRVILTLHGAESSAAVWLNGVFIGYGEDGFTPSRYLLTPALRAGENRLCVQVFKRCSGTWLEDQDFWRFSGIFRDVTLTLEPPAHVEDVFVHTPLSDDFSSGTLEAELKLRLTVPARLRLTLCDPHGGLVATDERAAEGKMTLACPVPHVALWSGEAPNLYTLTLSLVDAAGQALETAVTKVGFRRFEMKDGVMLLNGRRIVFHGVNRHEFHCERGRTLTEADMLEDVRLIKRMHINAVRTCHYPNDSRWYRLCDQHGIYLIDEANIESHGSLQPDPLHGTPDAVPDGRPEWLACVLDRGHCMLERDKNHPSVLLWSCGNESGGGQNLYELSQLFRRRDPSRLVHYEGVYGDPRYPDTTDVFSRMYAKPEDIVAYLSGNPKKPFINCEYTHAMGNSCGGMSLYTALEDEYPMYQGGFIWDFVDQALRVKGPNGEARLAFGGDFGDKPTDYHFNTNGILLGDRQSTPKVQEVRYLFQPAFLTPDASGVTIQNRRLFTDLADDLLLCWTVQLDGANASRGELALPRILPGETRRVPLPVEMPDAPGEVTLTCALVTRQADAFFAEGEEMAFGQAILRAAPAQKPARPSATGIVVCPYNAGVHTSSLHAIFSYAYPGMVSLKNAQGKEMLLQPPKLSLFRAPTDNDRGNQDSARQAVWHAMSENCFVSRPDIVREQGLLRLTYRYTCTVLPDFEMRVSYTCDSPDSVKVTAEFPGAKGQSDLPALGLSFLLDASLKHVTYYGLGPDENYADRCCGARLGRFGYHVADNFTRYARPQECGNRMGVRTLAVLDDNGAGVRVDMEDAPLEVSVLPWTAEQLEQAWHPDELTGSARTVLDVAMRRKGVGGDDSWGAPVKPQYLIPSDQPMAFSFRIRAM